MVSFLEPFINRLLNKMKIPEFLNTPEKWTKCVHETNSVIKFEELFTTLLEDDNITMIDVLKITKALEIDIVKYHKNEDIKSVLDIAEAIIRFMSIARKELDESSLIDTTTEPKQNGKD